MVSILRVADFLSKQYICIVLACVYATCARSVMVITDLSSSRPNSANLSLWPGLRSRTSRASSRATRFVAENTIITQLHPAVLQATVMKL